MREQPQDGRGFVEESPRQRGEPVAISVGVERRKPQQPVQAWHMKWGKLWSTGQVAYLPAEYVFRPGDSIS